MVTIAYRPEDAATVEADLLAVFALKDEDRARLGADASALATTLQVDLADELRRLGFDGERGSVARVPSRGGIAAGMLMVVGLGPADRADVDALRGGAAAAARNATKEATLALVVPGDLVEGAGQLDRAQAVAEGAGLGAYAFTAYRKKPHDAPSLRAIAVVGGQGLAGDQVGAGVEIGAVTTRATNLARDLVNEPPAGKRPPALAERVRAIADEAGLEIEVLDEQALAEGSFGGLIGVGQGSSAPPRLVEIRYRPEHALGHVVLVGKGITFDSGGLSLKPTQSMATMKSDMSGAAAIVGAMSALRDLGVQTNVTGLLALAENMPSGHALRVSDVITHRNGTTVEVMNTDAEGRLVLADALAYGVEQQPDAMIDLATLTGAQIVALGSRIAGLMGSDDALIRALRDAAAAAGEQVWHLPLPPEYREHLNSEVADLKNIGREREAGALVAGLFLKEFTGDVPWAHLDIAGPAYDEHGDGPLGPKGGTGMGVRTLLRYLQAR